MQLHNLQKAFMDATVHNALKGIADIVSGTTEEHVTRLGIYHNNVAGGLSDVLGETFHATRILVGDDFFNKMAETFVVQHLPTNANINLYGEKFPAFIAEYPAAFSVQYLADVARFEWLWNECYLAPNDAVLTSDTISKIAADDYPALHFTLRHSARLLAADYPVDSIWQYCMGDTESTPPPTIQRAGVFLLLLRPELEVLVVTLNRAEYLFLLSLSMGSDFENAATMALTEDPTCSLGAFLSRHFELGTFQKIS